MLNPRQKGEITHLVNQLSPERKAKLLSDIQLRRGANQIMGLAVNSELLRFAVRKLKKAGYLPASAPAFAEDVSQSDSHLPN